MRVRLKDVARVAGVSPKTVSRVLNDEANVHEPARTMRCDASMDYRPHLSARSQVSNREMMAHLLALGHRRIPHVIAHPAHGASRWRLAGYREALAAVGLPFDPELVVPGEFSSGPAGSPRGSCFRCCSGPRRCSPRTTTWPQK